jgi:fumarate reductase flavoprotein subunit
MFKEYNIQIDVMLGRSKIMNSDQISKTENLESDVVVVGGGGTGLAAALAAAEKGARVILLEKRNACGGNSVFPAGLFASDSPAQKRMSIAALKDDCFKIAMDYSHWSINPRILRAFLEKSGDTIAWLESKGLNFTRVETKFPNTEVRGFHSLGAGIRSGPVIVKTLYENCLNLGLRVFVNCPAEKIVLGAGGEVAGIRVSLNGESRTIKTKSIIIATGGYSGNQEMLKKYYPEYSENIVFLGQPNTGDGFLMANEIGAASEGLGHLLLHPHIYRGSVRIDALVQEPAFVWINKKGKRFAPENITFRTIECGNVINRQPDKCVYIILDRKLKKTVEEEGFMRGGIHGSPESVGVKVSDLSPDLQAGAAKGDIKIADSWADIAAWIGVEPGILDSTLSEYNHFCEQGYDEDFQKDRLYLKALGDPPYYAIRCYLSCLDTLGGIKINQHMEVLDKQEEPLPGLYAGGDAAGGWESETYCIVLPGTTCGFAINSGRIAGENAYKYISGIK